MADRGELEVVDMAAIADELGRKHQTVRAWRSTRWRGFPAPDFDLAIGPVWFWGTINEWAEDAEVRPKD
jgi:hypothetical protein